MCCDGYTASCFSKFVVYYKVSPRLATRLKLGAMYNDCPTLVIHIMHRAALQHLYAQHASLLQAQSCDHATCLAPEPNHQQCNEKYPVTWQHVCV